MFKMVKSGPKLLFIGLLAGLTGLLGCSDSSKSSPQATLVSQSPPLVLPLGVTPAAISEVKQKRDTEATVYLKGKVGKQAPLLGTQAYELQDSTGSIWILSQAATLQPGAEVLLKGKVRYQSIRVEGREMGELYIEELERSTNQTGGTQS